MATVVPAEGVILKRVLEAPPAISPEDLSREAYAKFDAAQMKTAWGRRHRRRFALVDGADVLASATQYDLVALLDERAVRVCGIGEIFTQPAHRDSGHTRTLVDRLLDDVCATERQWRFCFQICATITSQRLRRGFDDGGGTQCGGTVASQRSHDADPWR